MNNETITYLGEHLWAGQLGNVFIVLSFVAALTATLCYFQAHNKPEEISWLKMARWSFRIHSAGVLGIVLTLFWMLLNHYYEYAYVWQHSNNAMPMRYIFSCFWEGQEGSFLLWALWHVVIGNILIRTAKNYEAAVMAIVSLVQVFLASMLLGITIFETSIGVNPFQLLREHPDFMNLPFVTIPNYLSKLNGRGLNPLLQNYWMTIHPPTLFLGFALTLVPFAYALAGAWKKDYNGWQKAALPWTFFGIAILGIGILMGGAWAYEALSFGGFWAWDPVENASLVPWIILVGAGHVMIVNKNKSGSLFTTYFLSALSFILVLYSTFLTRSGILGNSSVHAFTDLGMQKQLLLFLLLFTALAVVFLIKERKLMLGYTGITLLIFLLVFAKNTYPSVLLISWGIISLAAGATAFFTSFPKDAHDEELWSREFWLFIGTLILLVSATTITIFTSIPIFNKLFGINTADFKAQQFNAWETPFAIVIVLLMAVTQFFKYKKTDMAAFGKKMRWSLIAALAFSILCTAALYFFKAWDLAPEEQRSAYITYAVLLFASVFAVFANTNYWLGVLKGRIKSAGASVAHIGFGLIILGALVSTSKKITLSKNTSGKNVEMLGKEYSNQESILLTQGDTLPMGPYEVCYTGKQEDGINLLYHVAYFKKGADGKRIKEFDLYPRIQRNDRMGNAAEPDTRHFFDRDIYTHVTYADLSTTQNEKGFGEPQNNVIHPGDTMFASNAFIILDSLQTNLSREQYEKNDSAIAVTAVLRAYDIEKKVYMAYPKYVLRHNKVQPETDEIKELGLKFTFWKINPENGSLEITLSEDKSAQKDFIVMKAFLFPYINVLWLGCVIMFIGTLLAVWQRIQSLKRPLDV